MIRTVFLIDTRNFAKPLDDFVAITGSQNSAVNIDRSGPMNGLVISR